MCLLTFFDCCMYSIAAKAFLTLSKAVFVCISISLVIVAEIRNVRSANDIEASAGQRSSHVPAVSRQRQKQHHYIRKFNVSMHSLQCIAGTISHH